MLLACLHDALAVWTRALVLDYNGSGDTGPVPLCHLLATNVITCVWLIVVHLWISALTSRQALITPGTNGVNCTVPRGPVSYQCIPIRLCPALTVRLLRIFPIQLAPSFYLCGLVFLILRANHSSHLSSGKPPATPRIFPVLHLIPALVSITFSVDLASIALSILHRTAFFTDLRVD